YVGGVFDSAGDVGAKNIARWQLGNVWTALGTGLQGYANAVAVNLHGEIFVGGSFTRAGLVEANNIAKWDGQIWQALGSGVGGSVHAVAVSGTDVYVSGNFATAGGVSAKYIARWDGTNWSAVGSGVDGPVFALGIDGSELYVGGAFGRAGDLAASNLARWNGSSWAALGSGTDGPVNVLTVRAGQVYAGGSFTQAGGLAALNLAHWDGNRWRALAGGVGKPVFALALAEDGSLFAGGESSDAGVVNGANNVAKWDGASWKVLGSGVNGTVRTLWVRGNEVYAGGSFTTAGAVSVMNLARWHDDVQSWVSLGEGTDNGVNGNIFGLAGTSSALYVAGIFSTAQGGAAARNFARFTFSRWEALGNGLAAGTVGGSIQAIAASETAVYVGGSFEFAGGRSLANIAQWDGTAWLGLGSGVNGPVAALALNPNGEVFAGGDFTQAGGGGASRLAKWDGSRWAALGLGLDGPVHALAMHGSDLYVGGEFARAGGFSAHNVARWDGRSWSKLGDGVNGKITALAVDAAGRVYAGGEFTAAGAVNVNHVAVWSGATWSVLGKGVDGSVAAMATRGTDVFVGGRFDSAGGSADIKNFARWDGVRWWALGSGVGGPSPYVNALAVHPGGAVYLAGEFTLAGDLPASRIARWDGQSWAILGYGVDDTVTALALRGREVFVGGRFLKAGKVPSLHFGRWTYANVPPSVSLASPGLGATFIAPADITLSANAADSDGTLTNVAFFAGASLLGAASHAPFAFTWTNVGRGIYSLSAKATDNDGASTTSSMVVAVVNTNIPPLVNLLEPPNNAAFMAPVNLALTADVFSSDDRVAQVEFFAGANSIGGLTSAPFSLTWSNVLAGDYVLSVAATDEHGAVTRSEPVNITVAAPEPLQLGAVSFEPTGQLQFELAGQPGSALVIEASTNLIEWVPLVRTNLATGRFNFVDEPAANVPWRFYRALYVP
ncbi:MAG: Ig-like domain-containing protein, partial [Verrucomicrobia bacterium]|nr:Ig-like domain-containing protein [Verrucomicrobiota bacterium]